MQVQQYPPDACPTLYAEGFPEDMTKRELAHIFRPFEGYKVGRKVEAMLCLCLEVRKKN